MQEQVIERSRLGVIVFVVLFVAAIVLLLANNGNI
jgi:hypothetical protein